MSALGKGLLDGFGGALIAKEQDYQQKKEFAEKKTLEEWKIEKQKEFTKWQLETAQKFEEDSYFTPGQTAIREDKTERALALAEAGAMRTEGKLSTYRRKDLLSRGLTTVASAAGIEIPESIKEDEKVANLRTMLKENRPELLSVFDKYAEQVNAADFDSEGDAAQSMLQKMLEEATKGVPGTATEATTGAQGQLDPQGMNQFFITEE